MNRLRSSRACKSWFTSAGVVVNATVKLFWKAAKQSASATCVFDLPLFSR